MTSGLALQEDGYLMPEINAIEVKFGASEVKHDDWFAQFCMGQIIDLAMVVIENSSYFIGKYVYSQQMQPILTYALNNYRLPFHFSNLIPGQKARGEFELDLKNTYQPFIGDNMLELYFTGELFLNNKSCGVNFKEVPMTWLTGPEYDKFSQVILTEDALSCIFNQFGNSPLGTIDWNQNRFD